MQGYRGLKVRPAQFKKFSAAPQRFVPKTDAIHDYDYLSLLGVDGKDTGLGVREKTQVL